MAQTIEVTSADGTLFHLAGKYLNDPLQWWRIAQMNGMSDYLIRGTLQLTIPDPDPSSPGGIPPQ